MASLSVSRYPVAVGEYAEYVIFNGDIRKRKPISACYCMYGISCR